MSTPPDSRRRRVVMIGALTAIFAALSVVVLRPRPAPPAPPAGKDVTLSSISLEMPADDQTFAGPHAEVMAANCAACHSPSMILYQPALTPEQWQATVEKMREVYKAPVAEADVPPILAYLDDLSAKRRGVAAR